MWQYFLNITKKKKEKKRKNKNNSIGEGRDSLN